MAGWRADENPVENLPLLQQVTVGMVCVQSLQKSFKNPIIATYFELQPSFTRLRLMKKL